MQALKTQIKAELEKFNAQEKSIETLFIGGGTPSTVSPKLYKPIFKLLQPYFKEDIEITSEANPNSATREWLEGMHKLGVNRLSFGVQSFNDAKLKLLHRAHNSMQAKEAIVNAKEVGFENISLDIIYATLGDTKELLQNDLEEAFKLPINHLSAYALTIEENTLFEKKPHMSKEKLELTNWLFEAIQKHNFTQYEISNFGTYHSQHNIGYWKYKDYIGAGSGAVGKLDNKRFYTNSNIEEYIQNPNLIETEILSEDDIRIEKIFLGLRSFVGVNQEILTDTELQKAKLLVQEEKLSFSKNIFYNNELLLADEIALFLSS